MKKSILIHNPRCSKSRGAKEILEAEGVEFEVIDYLKDGLKEKLLLNLPKLTGLTYPEMVRTKEEAYSQLGLKDRHLTQKEWVEILMKNPILLERPIFIHNDKAVVARPSELVKSIL